MRPVTLGQLDFSLRGAGGEGFLWDPEKTKAVLREDSSKT